MGLINNKLRLFKSAVYSRSCSVVHSKNINKECYFLRACSASKNTVLKITPTEIGIEYWMNENPVATFD